MRILLITVRSDFGGGPRHVDQLVEKLPEDIVIFMAYPEGGKPYADKWRNNSRIANSIYIPYRRFSLKALYKLRSFVIKNKIDIVHSHGNGAGLYSRLLKILNPKVKVVHTFHGISDNYASKIKYVLSMIIGKILRIFADKYICVSQGEKNMSIERGFSNENNTVVIYNGISKQ